MFKVNNKDTKATLLAYFTPCSSVPIVNFEQVNASRAAILKKWKRRLVKYMRICFSYKERLNLWGTSEAIFRFSNFVEIATSNLLCLKN